MQNKNNTELYSEAEVNLETAINLGLNESE
jgi:hypothetical protein